MQYRLRCGAEVCSWAPALRVFMLNSAASASQQASQPLKLFGRGCSSTTCCSALLSSAYKLLSAG